MTGALIVLFVVVTSFVAGTVSALFQEDAAPASTAYARCTSSDTNATCENLGKTSFLHNVFEATILPFGTSDGIGGFLSVMWLLVMGFLLAAGIILIVLAFIPFTAG